MQFITAVVDTNDKICKQLELAYLVKNTLGEKPSILLKNIQHFYFYHLCH